MANFTHIAEHSASKKEIWDWYNSLGAFRRIMPEWEGIRPMNAGRLGVRGIPALFLFKEGNLVSQKSGALPKPQLLKWIDEHMGADDF